MQQKNSAENFFMDMQEKMKDMMNASPVASAFDLKTIMDAQRKNMQALTEVNHTMMNGWQDLAKRQAEMMGQFVQNNSSLARETMKEGTPQDKFSRQTDIIKNACEKTMANSQELMEMVRKNNLETAELITKRLMNSMTEIKKSVVAED